MELLGALSNQAQQERLQQLADKLDRLAASKAQPRPSARVDQRIRSGVVLQAVARVLATAKRPLRACEIHRAVSTLLKQPVPYGTVKRSLSGGIQGPKPRFERISWGRYQLRRS